MNTSTSFAAQLLETSASAYAGSAASLLLERQPEIAERYAPTALKAWRQHLRQRLLELSAALDAEEPKLFSARVAWEGKALQARQVDERDLHAALNCLQEVLRESLPALAQDTVASYLATAFETFDAAPSQDLGLDPDNPRERLVLQYLEAALKGESKRAIDLLVSAVGEELSIKDAYEVLLAAQREVGRMWHVGALKVAEEHLVTATTERATSFLAGSAPRQPDNGKTIVVAAVATNRHGLPVRILADFFEIAGWRSICLGADVPADDLATAAAYFDADLLALSVALPTQLKATRQTIAAVRALPARDIKIVVGGGAFAAAPELWRRLGADGCIPTLSDAVALGRRVLGLAP